jgi:hypothetical protein
MKRLLNLFFVVLIGVLLFPGTAAKQQGIIKRGEEVLSTPSIIKGLKLTMNPNFGKVPLYFIPNKGQVNEKAKFYAKTSRYTLWMTKDGLVFDSFKKVEVKAEVEKRPTHPAPSGHPRRGPYKASQEGDTPRPLRVHPSQEGIVERDVSRLVFLNANKNPVIVPLEITQHKVNYFIGSDPGKWQKGISTSKVVLYKDIYKNIDLKVYGNESQVEYDWIVKPGGNPTDIRFEYKNVTGARIDKKGNLLIKTKFGELLHKKPVSCQLINGEKVNVESAFKRVDKNTYGFDVHEFSKDYELIIDPVVSLTYSTYLGGSNYDWAQGIKVNDSGNIIITGYTGSTNFPVSGTHSNIHSGGADVFVTKFSSDGLSLIYSTYLGGDSVDVGRDIALTINDYAYITGYTMSINFPVTTNDSYGGNDDAFVSCLNGEGRLEYSRYLGGTEFDRSWSIAVDKWGNAYVTGYTKSTNFPILNPYQDENGGEFDAFISKLHYNLGLIYSTYLGGSYYDSGRGIAADSLGSFYVSGNTYSVNFPIRNPYQESKMGSGIDTFFCKFKPDGSDLIYSSYLGGLGLEDNFSIAVTNSGSIVIMGRTTSADFPTKNALQNTYAGNDDIYVTKINAVGSDLIYSTFLGGTNCDTGWLGGGIAVDSFGNAYVSGFTDSIDFPIKNAYQNDLAGLLDIFITKITVDGSDIIFSTYLGGTQSDRAHAITVDSFGNVYITGLSDSSNFPTINPYQDLLAGIYDVILSRLCYVYILAVQSAPETGVPITVTPTDCNGSGDGETNFTRNYDPGTLVTLTAPETFNDRIFRWWTIDGNDVFDRSIQVTMDSGQTATAVYQTPGELSLSRSQLYFGVNTSGTATGGQTFFISKSDESTLNWTVSDNTSWLTCSPNSGTNSGEVTVSLDASGLTAGTYYGTITVSAPNASNSPQHVNVTLLVYKANTTGVPFGYFETPRDRAYVYSSIPVTGWALDDIEVENVKIYRNEGKNLVYIGDAVFVEGARPDVELAYPNYPNCYRAGWGYMMLTNFLPNGGNGTFKIYAIATDKEGHQVTLGTKTIYCDNAHAVKPFGAIDTPSQGGTVIGTNYRNQGWVLTPLPNIIPEDGHTIIVWIDGVNLGNPIYNIYRADIATLFPGYANSNGAMAYFDFDTTAYENGVHTIQWTAVDNAGNVDGIGSRYFTIQNTGENSGRTAQSAELTAAAFNVQPSMFNLNPSRVPPDYSTPIRVRKGYNQNIKPHKRFPDETGNIFIQIKELERIELQLFEGTRGLAPLPNFSELSSNNRMGFLVVGNQLRTLPVGSTFNPQKGIFYWQPGPGFIGTYRFIFLEEKQNREWSKTFITVNILPKFTGKAD